MTETTEPTVGSLAGVVPGIIDAHIHQWDPFTTPREASKLAPLYKRASKLAPLYKRAPRLMERLMPLVLDQGTRELVRTARHAARPYLPADYAADVAGTEAAVGVPVEAAVHVQAGWHDGSPAGETAWVDALPFGKDGNPALAAIVAEADPRRPDFTELLDAHAHASARFRGIRFMTTWHPDKGVKNWIDEEGVMTSRAFLDGFAAIARRGLTFDAYVYSHQLDEVVVLAKEYPDTTIVLDHYGPPVGYLGPMGKATGRTAADRAALLDRWRDAVAEVAACPNVVAKHSGIAFPSLGLHEPGIGRERLAGLVRPLVEHTTEVFGEDRLVFGSNYPMDKSNTAYPTIVGALVDLLAPRGPALLRKVFRENAQAVYRL